MADMEREGGRQAVRGILPQRLTQPQSREVHRQAGFTLIELMVVVLIIAILLAIAIPTFLGAKNRASDRSAQSDLRNTLAAAISAFTGNGQNFNNITDSVLSSEEPAYTWRQAGVDASCTTSVAHCIDWHVDDVNASGDGQSFELAAPSKTGTCWYVGEVLATPSGTFGEYSGGAYRNITASGTYYYQHTSASCAANDMDNSPGAAGSGTVGTNWATAESF